MKRKNKFAALALVVSLALSCCIVPAMAQEESTAIEDTATEDTATEDTATEDASLADSEENANSWRYSNGVPIQGASTSTSSAISTFSAIATLSTNYTTWPTVTGAVAVGIDVSKWQGDIDWAAAKDAGVDYAIIRCGYGLNDTSNDDPYWEINASACEALGIPYGTYIYSYATNVEEAVSEAEHVLRLVEGHTLSYPIYYDLEDDTLADLSPSELAAIAQAFCSTIEAAGYTVGVYANLYWWTTKLTDPVFDNWERWVAQWDTSCDYTGAYTMWQCSSKGIVNGISGNVDLNIDFGAALSAPVTVCTHDYVAGAQTDPTCTAEGSVPYTCSKCGASYTETVAATGHVAGEAVTDSSSSDTVVNCTVCGEELSRVTNTESTGSMETVEVTVSGLESVESMSGLIDEIKIIYTDGADGDTSAGNTDSNGTVDASAGTNDSDTAVDNIVSASPSSNSANALANTGSGGNADSSVTNNTSVDNTDSNATNNDANSGSTGTGGESGAAVLNSTESGENADNSTETGDDTGSGSESPDDGSATATSSAGTTGSDAGTALLSAAVDEEEDSESTEADDDTSEDSATATSSTDTPATGDSTNTMVWTISLLMASTASVMIMMSYRRRTRRAKQIADIIETFDHVR